jgi:hypothetical protein
MNERTFTDVNYAKSFASEVLFGHYAATSGASFPAQNQDIT